MAQLQQAEEHAYKRNMHRIRTEIIGNTSRFCYTAQEQIYKFQGKESNQSASRWSFV